VAGPTQNPFGKAFACAGITFVAVIIAAVALLGAPHDTYYGSELAGRLFAAVAIAALVAGFFARRSKKIWPMWRIIAIYAVALVIILALYANGTRGH
jgi:cell shape-determining protein MreD